MPANKTLVIHVVTTLDFGGVEKHMELIGGCAAQAGMAHHFCAIGGGGAAERALKAAGVEVHLLNVDFRIPGARAIMELWRLFKRLKPGVVHTHGAEANFHGLPAARLAGVPARVGEEIGIPSHSAHARVAFRQVYRAAHRVVGISDAVRDWLVDSKEVAQGKAVRIYNPVRLPEPRATGPGPDAPFRIAFVGRLEPVKNPMALLRAFHRLRECGTAAELWVVGDGSERAGMETYIRTHGLQDGVRMAGFQQDVSRYLRECDVYVQPSISEGFGLALVEAMGCGLPVLATRVGGAVEIIEQGRTGWLLEGSDVHGVLRGLESALALGRERLQYMGRLAAASVRGRFEPENYLQDLEQFYLELLQRRPLPA